jgi:hypothetical protein
MEASSAGRDQAASGTRVKATRSHKPATIPQEQEPRTDHPESVELTITPSAQILLEQFTSVKHVLGDALVHLSKLFPVRLTVNLDRFVDPYDGSQMLTVTVNSGEEYESASRLIDQFCSDWWFEVMERSPLTVIFQAGD